MPSSGSRDPPETLQRRPSSDYQTAVHRLQKLSTDSPVFVQQRTITMSTKTKTVVDAKPESGEIKTALLTPADDNNGKNGSHAPSSTTVSVENVAGEHVAQEVGAKTRKIVHIHTVLAEEISNNANARRCLVWTAHVVLLVMPYVAILVGVTYQDECPAYPIIPIQLIVAGVVLSLLHLSTSLDKFRGLPYLQSDETKKPAILTFITVFFFVWIILGLVWTFSIYLPDYDIWRVYGRGYCNYLLYWFSIWFNIITLIVLVVAWFFCCCVCNMMCNISILTWLCSPFVRDTGSDKEDAV